MTNKELKEKIDNWFTDHTLTDVQRYHMQRIGARGRDLALRIAATQLDQADKMAAIRKVREAVMTANAGIVCHEEVDETTTPEDVEKSEDEDGFKGIPPAPTIPPARIWPTPSYNSPWDGSLPCSYCSGPIYIAGPWTCPKCGVHYPVATYLTAPSTQASVPFTPSHPMTSWKSDACGLNENKD